MSFGKFFLACAVTVTFITGPAAAQFPSQPPQSGVVVYVYDGDTIQALLGGRKYKVRLLGIDTPETDGPYTKAEPLGEEAKARTKRLALGKKVTLEFGADSLRDKYNRLLAYVTLPDGRCLNQILIQEGLAEAFHRGAYTRKKLYHKLEAEARKHRLGIWKYKRYRNKNHRQRSTPKNR